MSGTTMVRSKHIERELMTDVSPYARDARMSQRVLFSPQVLKDVKDIPPAYEKGGELDVTRIMKILGQLKNAILRAKEASDVPFESFLAIRRENEEGLIQPYPLNARINPETKEIEVLTPIEAKKGLQATEELRKEVLKLRSTLSLPRSSTFPRMN